MKYVQAPVGWWQDSRGRKQPPGSFLSPELRVGEPASSGFPGMISSFFNRRRRADVAAPAPETGSGL
jgi:hypothetical protein